MEERIAVKKVLKRTIDMNQEDLETMIKVIIGNKEGAEWSFNFDLDNYGNVKATVIKKVTETECE